jgi:hypothetical protein
VIHSCMDATVDRSVSSPLSVRVPGILVVDSCAEAGSLNGSEDVQWTYSACWLLVIREQVHTR